MSDDQKSLHVMGEAGAILLVPVFLRLASSSEPLTEEDKLFLRTFAIVTLALDGWLLWKNLT